MLRLTILASIMLTGCTTKTIVKKVPVYCDYVRLPNITYLATDHLEVTFHVNKDGIVDNMTIATLEFILNKNTALQGLSDSKDIEIDYYREYLERHNDTCTNPIFRERFEGSI